MVNAGGINVQLQSSWRLARTQALLLSCIAALCVFASSAASANAAIDSAAAPGQSITLPSGHGKYLFLGSTSGDQAMGSISWLAGQDLAVTAAGTGNQAISIGHTTSNTGSFSSTAAGEAIAGVGLDGYTVVQTFSAQHSRPAHKATRHPEKALAGPALSLPIKTTAANQLVLILAGSQGAGALQLSGLEASPLQNATYGLAQTSEIASAAVYTAQLPPGKHKLKLRSSTYAPNSGTSLGVVAYVLEPVPLPAVANVSPNTGPEGGGTPVTITGANLAGATEVSFGAASAQSFKVNSPTSIEAVSPAGTATVDVTVRTESATSATNPADQFSYLPPQPVDAYNNYSSATAGHAMCRGNPGRPESMPGGTATQTFTIPAGVASLSNAVVDVDPDPAVTAHLTLIVNGAVRATAASAATGDTGFSWPAVAVTPGDEAALSISFTATFGKIITIYSAAAEGGTLTYSNSCSDGAPSGTSANGLRAVVAGLSP
jgi:IPT/TIG domain